jgi:hypothetical protein
MAIHAAVHIILWAIVGFAVVLVRAQAQSARVADRLAGADPQSRSVVRWTLVNRPSPRRPSHLQAVSDQTT